MTPENLHLSGLATTENSGIRTSATLRLPRTPEPALDDLATVKNFGICVQEAFRQPETQEFDSRQPLGHQELGNLRDDTLADFIAQDLQPDGLATIKNSEICILAALRPPETQSNRIRTTWQSLSPPRRLKARAPGKLACANLPTAQEIPWRKPSTVRRSIR